jgi:hypothetical protein
MARPATTPDPILILDWSILKRMVGNGPSTDGSRRRKWGLRSHKGNRASGGLGAAPVEGGFGDDFVRRNRSQLRHAFECWW